MLTSKRIRAEALAPLLRPDPSKAASLQEQLRRAIINALSLGTIAPGAGLPSSRTLSEALSVSRNTVTLAYQRLVADGHLEARERSGIYAPQAPLGPRAADLVRRQRSAGPSERTPFRPPVETHESDVFLCPPDWQSYRFPFIEGRFDRSLFPISEWREASKLALAAAEVEAWSRDNGEADDEMLIEEIRTKLLPRRGIAAARDEILITVGEQQALFLAVELFAAPGVVAGVENPGLPEVRDLMRRRGASLRAVPVDEEGVQVGFDLEACSLVHVSPSRQRPTGVTLSKARREALMAQVRARKLVVIEDDYECEMNYIGATASALRSMPGANVWSMWPVCPGFWLQACAWVSWWRTPR